MPDPSFSDLPEQLRHPAELWEKTTREPLIDGAQNHPGDKNYLLAKKPNGNLRVVGVMFDVEEVAFAVALRNAFPAIIEAFRQVQRERDEAARRLTEVRTILETAVCTEGCDKGVVMLSQDGPTHLEPIGFGGRNVEVYDHDYFSPLGDALISAWEGAAMPIAYGGNRNPENQSPSYAELEIECRKLRKLLKENAPNPNPLVEEWTDADLDARLKEMSDHAR